MARRIALALLAVGLLAAGLWLVARKEDREARAERASSRLPAFDARAVTAFTVETPSGPYRVVRGGSGWRIASPVDDAASAKAVEAFLAAARTTPVIQTLSSPDALSSYGLEPPVARVTFEGVEAPSLEIGHVAPAGDGVFARIPGRAGVLILKLPDGQALVDPDVGRLRDPSVVDLERSGITSVDILPGGVRLARSGDTWWIEAPRRFPAAATQVDRLLGAIYDAKVVGSDDAGSPDDPRFGLGRAGLHLTLHAADASREVVLGGDAGEGRHFVASEGRRTVLIVEAPAPSTLPTGIEALRDTRLTNVNRYAVARFAYASPGRRFAATKKDEDTWSSEAGATVRPDEVYALLVKLLEAPTTAWSEGTLAGSPSATLDYTTASGETGRVQIYGERAVWSGLPGVWFRLGAAAPPVPSPSAAAGQ